MSTTQTWEDLQKVDDVREMADVPSEASIAMQSQYAHAPNFKALAEIFHTALDATEQLDQLLKDVADARTAKGVFLDWWGKRVGVDRLIEVDGEFIRFDDDYYRFLIMYRALCNISDSSAATMNRLLSQLTDQQVFIVDYQNMSIRSIVLIVPNATMGVFAGRFEPRPTLKRSILLFTAAALVAFGTLIHPSVWVLLISIALTGAGNGAACSSGLRFLLAGTSIQERAGVISALYLSAYVGSVIPNLVIASMPMPVTETMMAIGFSVWVLLTLIGVWGCLARVR